MVICYQKHLMMDQSKWGAIITIRGAATGGYKILLRSNQGYEYTGLVGCCGSSYEYGISAS